MLSFSRSHSLKTICHSSYHKAHLSKLRGLHSMEFLFGYTTDHFSLLWIHLDLLVQQILLLIKIHLHSEFIFIYFEISMQNIERMQTFKPIQNLNCDIPNLFFLKQLIFFLVLHYFLIQIPIIKKLHNNTKIINSIPEIFPLQKNLLIPNDIIIFDRRENSDLIEGIFDLFIRKIG